MIETIATVLLGLLVVTVVMTVIRLLIGPKLPDRVIALDTMASIGIAVAALYTLFTDEPEVLDIALVVALLGFLSTVAFGYFLERYRQ